MDSPAIISGMLARGGGIMMGVILLLIVLFLSVRWRMQKGGR
jgi:hypothetical protein